MQRIADILLTCGTPGSRLPATLLYNEGWMVRLVLDWFAQQAMSDHPLSFAPAADWYTEALLPSAFRPRSRGDHLAESRTHADGVIGHIEVGRAGRGDLSLSGAAAQLTIVEAKLFSPLSAGTRRAPGYDQAARNVACIAEVVRRAEIRSPVSLAFVVLAPAEHIQIDPSFRWADKGSIEAKVRARAAAYDGAVDRWVTETFLPVLEAVRIAMLSWESVIEYIGERDAEAGHQIGGFYSACLDHNRPRFRRAAT
jgi:hypothetical protein